MKRFLLLVLVCAPAACGGSVQSDDASDAAIDSRVVVDSTPPVDSAIDSGVDVTIDAPVDAGECDAQALAIAPSWSAGSCTATIDVTRDAKIAGWAVFCGDSKPTAEPDARAAFAPYAGPYTPIDTYTTYGGGTGFYDEYVFYHPPSDFGGLGVVSQVRGDVVFAAQLSWMGPTTLEVPKAWKDPSLVTAMCPTVDLGPTRYVSIDGSPLDATVTAKARTAIGSSPLVRAMQMRGHGIVNAVVTQLPNEMGPADFLFFLNSAVLD